MTEIQMEELKATVCMVGIASASNWVFRVLMIVLTLCSFGLVMVLKKKQRLENETDGRSLDIDVTNLRPTEPEK